MAQQCPGLSPKHDQGWESREPVLFVLIPESLRLEETMSIGLQFDRQFGKGS